MLQDVLARVRADKQVSLSAGLEQGLRRSTLTRFGRMMRHTFHDVREFTHVLMQHRQPDPCT